MTKSFIGVVRATGTLYQPPASKVPKHRFVIVKDMDTHRLMVFYDFGPGQSNSSATIPELLVDGDEVKVEYQKQGVVITERNPAPIKTLTLKQVQAEGRDQYQPPKRIRNTTHGQVGVTRRPIP